MEHQGKSLALQERWQNDWQDMKYEGIVAKAPPCPERRVRTQLLQESPSSTREEESQWSSMERCRRRVAFGDAAKRMLRYLEDSEDLKVSVSDLKGQLEKPEEEGFSIMQIAQQARNERGQKLFETFRQGKDDVHCQFGEMEHTMERSGGAGTVLSGRDAGSGTIK